MRNQLVESRSEAEALREKRQTAARVLDHLTGEHAAACERLEAARVEVEVIEAQRAEQVARSEHA